MNATVSSITSLSWMGGCMCKFSPRVNNSLGDAQLGEIIMNELLSSEVEKYFY